MIKIPQSSRLAAGQQALLMGLTIAIGLFTPSVTLVAVQCVVGDIPLGTAVTDVLGKQFRKGHNLFALALIGLIPFVVLAVKLRAYAANRTRRERFALCLSGLVGILALMIPVHVGVWYPLYGPGRMSSTGVIAFLFIPFYCVGSLFVGLFIGDFITRTQWFRAHPIGHCQRCGYDLRGNVSGVCPECGSRPQNEPKPGALNQSHEKSGGNN